MLLKVCTISILLKRVTTTQKAVAALSCAPHVTALPQLLQPLQLLYRSYQEFRCQVQLLSDLELSLHMNFLHHWHFRSLSRYLPKDLYHCRWGLRHRHLWLHRVDQQVLQVFPGRKILQQQSLKISKVAK